MRLAPWVLAESRISSAGSPARERPRLDAAAGQALPHSFHVPLRVRLLPLVRPVRGASLIAQQADRAERRNHP